MHVGSKLLIFFLAFPNTHVTMALTITFILSANIGIPVPKSHYEGRETADYWNKCVEMPYMQSIICLWR